MLGVATAISRQLVKSQETHIKDPKDNSILLTSLIKERRNEHGNNKNVKREVLQPKPTKTQSHKLKREGIRSAIYLFTKKLRDKLRALLKLLPITSRTVAATHEIQSHPSQSSWIYASTAAVLLRWSSCIALLLLLLLVRIVGRRLASHSVSGLVLVVFFTVCAFLVVGVAGAVWAAWRVALVGLVVGRPFLGRGSVQRRIR